MTQNIGRKIELVIFDLDDTLLYCMDEPPDDHIALSDNGSGPGSPDYTFRPVVGFGRTIQRDDGRRFVLFPEVPDILRQLDDAGIHMSLASFNYPRPVFRALEALDILQFFKHPVTAWTPRKGLMIELILASFDTDRRLKRQGKLVQPVERARVLFVDNSTRYYEDATRAGISFFHLRSHEDLLRLAEEILRDSVRGK